MGNQNEAPPRVQGVIRPTLEETHEAICVLAELIETMAEILFPELGTGRADFVLRTVRPIRDKFK